MLQTWDRRFVVAPPPPPSPKEEERRWHAIWNPQTPKVSFQNSASSNTYIHMHAHSHTHVRSLAGTNWRTHETATPSMAAIHSHVAASHKSFHMSSICMPLYHCEPLGLLQRYIQRRPMYAFSAGNSSTLHDLWQANYIDIIQSKIRFPYVEPAKFIIQPLFHATGVLFPVLSKPIPYTQFRNLLSNRCEW